MDHAAESLVALYCLPKFGFLFALARETRFHGRAQLGMIFSRNVLQKR